MATLNKQKLIFLRLGLVGATMLMARLLLPAENVPAQSALVALTYAIFALLALIIFRPAHAATSISLLRWCMTVAVFFALALIADPATRSLLVLIPRLTITLLLLAATITLATRRLPVSIVVTGVTLFTLITVWAAPAIELAGNPIDLTNAIVAASPLTHFAVALDLDVLRTNWFYANSALGSMRYSYPGWANACLLFSILPAAALLRSLAVPFNPWAKEAHP